MSTLREVVPWGRELPEADFAIRHRLVRVVLAAHLPVLAAVALAVGEGVLRTLAELTPLVLLLAAATVRLPARVRALAASLGLIGCSALTVHLAGGLVEAHFHYFVAVTLVAVYEDASIYLAAVAFVLLEHGIVGVLDPGVFTHATGPWVWATVHAVAILAQSAALFVYWRYSCAARRREGSYRDQLYAGHDSVLSRQEQLMRLRQDLVGTVSHKFRTPLTGIRGTLQLLQRHGDRLPTQQQAELLSRGLAAADRLGRLIDNMLAAAQPDRGECLDSAPVAAVAGDAADAVRAAHTGRRPRMSISVGPDLAVRVPWTPLRHVLTNLLDNAIVHGRPDRPVRLAAWRDDDRAIVTPSNA